MILYFILLFICFTNFESRIGTTNFKQYELHSINRLSKPITNIQKELPSNRFDCSQVIILRLIYP